MCLQELKLSPPLSFHEIFLIGSKMLTFIDHILHVNKQIHNQFMGGLDNIMIGELYQAPLV